MTAPAHKDVQTKRGLTYHYLFLAPQQPGKPTIVFLHGFPSTTRDWRFQIDYFSGKGYGLIVPDMLGYGGTDKPTDLKYYSWQDMSTDIVDILDAENIDRTFVVGHDWGCAVVSRLALLPSERFLGFGWLGVGFLDLSTGDFNLEERMAAMKAVFGNEIFGYWTLLTRDDAAPIIEDNIDSFLNVVYPADPELWRTVMNIPGVLEDWLRKGNRTARPNYLSEEEYNLSREALLKGGLATPLNWYKATVAGVNRQDNPGQSIITKPVFGGAALRDYVTLAAVLKKSFPESVSDLTIVDFDTGHWLQLEEPDKVNAALEAWMESRT